MAALQEPSILTLNWLFQSIRLALLDDVCWLTQVLLYLASNLFDLPAQTGLAGCPSYDVSTMFDGDNVAHHLNQLFDHNPLTRSVSTSDGVRI